MKNHKISTFLAALIVCQLPGWLGALFTQPAIDSWYVNLIKPAFRPPNWAFAPVWSLLFLLMGISLYLILIRDSKHKKVALIIFSIQLIFNFMWSFIFFGLKDTGLAFLEIIVLWLLIFFSILIFYKISKPAAYLLLPYILWVSFAAVLNLRIWQLN